MRPRAIRVRESVLIGQVPRAEYSSALLRGIRIRRQRRHRAPHEKRRFGCEKVWLSLPRVTPVRFRHAEMLEHVLGAKKTRRNRYCCYVPLAQFVGHGERQTDHRRLYQVVENIAAITPRIAIRDFDDQSLPASEHKWSPEMRRDNVRVHRALEHCKAFFQRDRPERLSELRQLEI